MPLLSSAAKHFPIRRGVLRPAQQRTRPPPQHPPYPVCKHFQIVKTSRIVRGDGKMRCVANGSYIVSAPRVEQGFLVARVRTHRIVINKHHAPLAFAGLRTNNDVRVARYAFRPAPSIAPIEDSHPLVKGKLPQIKTAEPRWKTEEHSQSTLFWRPRMLADVHQGRTCPLDAPDPLRAIQKRPH